MNSNPTSAALPTALPTHVIDWTIAPPRQPGIVARMVAAFQERRSDRLALKVVRAGGSVTGATPADPRDALLRQHPTQMFRTF